MTLYSAGCQAINIPDGDEVRFLRFTVPAGKSLKIRASSCYPAGVANFNVEVRNITDGTTDYQNNATFNSDGDLATIGANKDVAFRLLNNSGGEQTGAIGWIAFTVE